MRGWPETKRGKVMLRAVALAQILLTFVVLVPAALWYGLHEMPGFLRESIRPAVLVLWRGKAGPYKGIYW